MVKRFGFVILAALAGGAASAASPDRPNPKGEAELAKIVAGRTAGAPVPCINPTDQSNVQIVDGTALIYRGTGRTLYVNRPRGERWKLDDDDILVSQRWGSQVCNLDQIRLLDRSTRFPRGFVVLGQFTPYTSPPKH